MTVFLRFFRFKRKLKDSSKLGKIFKRRLRCVLFWYFTKYCVIHDIFLSDLSLWLLEKYHLRVYFTDPSSGGSINDTNYLSKM